MAKKNMYDVKQMIDIGKEKSFLNYDVNDVLPDSMEHSTAWPNNDLINQSLSNNVIKQQKPSDPLDSYWIPQGQLVEMEDCYSIPGGFIYFGSVSKSIQEPYFINTRLPVDDRNPDHSGTYLNTNHPSYSKMHPICRAAYLEWLSTGRKDPKVHIGYVNLFFCGLERRALAHIKDSASAQNDLPAIIMEAKRLLSIYNENSSFHEQVSTFLNVLQVSQTTGLLYRNSPQINVVSSELPLTFRLALSQMARDSVPLTAEWALTWVSMMYHRTPVQRCPEEFCELFRIRYNDKFGDGLKLEPGNENFQVMYRPMINTYSGWEVDIPIPNFPDLMEISWPSPQIRDLVDACADELKGYSRYLGQNPNSRNSIVILTFLPQPLLKKHVETWLHLTEDEKMRLRPQWLFSSLPGMNDFKNRIKQLKQDQLVLLGKFLEDITTDCNFDPPELKILTKIHEMLGLDSRILYSHGRAAAIEPVTVQTADPTKQRGYAIPAPPQPSHSFSLDMSSIEAKVAETVAVSAILKNIFSEEAPVTPQTVVPESTTTEVSIAGLDADSFTFMQTLASKHIWARDELEKLAADHSLMLDGTLDSINDASYDHFGGPFFEGDDPIEINPEFAKEIIA